MRTICAVLILAAAVPTGVGAADLGLPPPPPDLHGGGAGYQRYHRLWGGPEVYPPDGPRPRRRIMGGPDYVGSTWGLGKPPVSGIGPRPDWGRSNYD